MNKKGIALAIVLWVVAIFSVIIASLFIRVLNERNLVKRHINTVKSFWLAESAISESFVSLSDTNSIISQSEGCPSEVTCSYSTIVDTIDVLGSNYDYFRITATGEVKWSETAKIINILVATVKAEPRSASNFQHAVESNGDIISKGSVDIDGTENPNAALNFSSLFMATKEEVENAADNSYDQDNFAEPVDGITWVEVSPGEELKTAGNLQGSGILVVNGDCHISGTEDFDGIIYVIGGLTITGTVNIEGTVLSESEANIDTELKGNVAITHKPEYIDGALGNLGYLSKSIIAWQQ